MVKLKRREQRKMVRAKLENLIDYAQTLVDLSFEGLNREEALKKGWPLLKPGFEIAELSSLTGKKADQVLLNLVEIGDGIVNDTASDEQKSEFYEKFQKKWIFWRGVLNAITLLTNRKIDDIIDNIIDFGDFITGIEDEN